MYTRLVNLKLFHRPMIVSCVCSTDIISISQVLHWWIVAPDSYKGNPMFLLMPSGLKTILLEKMNNEIPVICVIGIMGTTEESAVDPLEDIFKIREELSKMKKV